MKGDKYNNMSGLFLLIILLVFLFPKCLVKLGKLFFTIVGLFWLLWLAMAICSLFC